MTKLKLVPFLLLLNVGLGLAMSRRQPSRSRSHVQAACMSRCGSILRGQGQGQAPRAIMHNSWREYEACGLLCSDIIGDGSRPRGGDMGSGVQGGNVIDAENNGIHGDYGNEEDKEDLDYPIVNSKGLWIWKRRGLGRTPNPWERNPSQAVTGLPKPTGRPGPSQPGQPPSPPPPPPPPGQPAATTSKLPPTTTTQASVTTEQTAAATTTQPPTTAPEATTEETTTTQATPTETPVTPQE